MHQPDPLIGFVDNIELASISLVRGEYLEDAKLYLSIINISVYLKFETIEKLSTFLVLT